MVVRLALLALAALSALVAAATVLYVARREPEYRMEPWAECDDGWGIGV